MDFTNGQIYHVFNRGNNSQTVFFNRENYLFFLKKSGNVFCHMPIFWPGA